MSTALMSLETLSFLLQHMDANKRFEIRQRCPSLREFEKSVPLKINSLVLTEGCVTMNDTAYRIGSIRKSKTGETPRHVAELHEAMKHMATMLFAGKSSPIHVTKLGIDFLIPGIIRLPISLKLHIEQLVFRAGSGTTVGVLAPILQESSFPLKKLEIGGWSDEDVTNPMVKTAESLRIRGYLTNIPQALSSITNPVVCISMQMLPEEAIEKLVENWIESQRPVGYKYIFDFYCEPRFTAEMEDMLKELNGVIIDDENVIIPMSECTQLKVSYGPFPDFAPRSKWAVRFLTELKIEH
ncbi:unnamed protein product [Caenorhabditis brenneri]